MYVNSIKSDFIFKNSAENNSQGILIKILIHKIEWSL